MTWPERLVSWYGKTARDLPWRRNTDPYRVWISEMMLQQTQVDTVIPYFNRFISQFPDIHALAKADLQVVLKHWEGLGYYARARNLHKAAKRVSLDLAGVFPKTSKDLQELPGIGPYASAAIASIAHGEKIAVVDGNVFRVFTRFWNIREDIRRPGVKADLQHRLNNAIKNVDASAFNQGMMELGATLCKPKQADCPTCPLNTECHMAFSKERLDLPFKSKSAPIPHHTIGVVIIQNKETILIAKRKEDQMLGGLWEFPGGKQEKGEDIKDTIHREAKEELGVTLKNLEKLCEVKHAYTHFKITLHAYTANLNSGKARALSSDEIRWIKAEDLRHYPFPRANKKVLDTYLASAV